MEAEGFFIPVMASYLYRQTALLHRREWHTRGVFSPCRLDLQPQDLMSSGTDRGVMLTDNGFQRNTQVALQVSGSRAPLPKPSPLRTGRDGLPSSGSSLRCPVPDPRMVSMMTPPVYQL